MLDALPSKFVIRAPRLMVRPDEPVVSDGAVLVGNGVILAVGARSEVERECEPGTVSFEYANGTIMPGMIDGHVHLAFDGSKTTVQNVESEGSTVQVLGMASRARQLLESGVTTVRDLGCRDYLTVALREAIDAGTIAGPRILSAGAPVTITGGHCWFLGGEADGVDEIRMMVRRNIKMGADVIKVMVSGGNMTPNSVSSIETQFSTTELRVAADEAHRFGKSVAAHAHSADAIESAVDAGFDTIEHCGWLTESGSPERRIEVMNNIVRAGTWISPTIGASITRPPYEFKAPRAVENLRWYRESGVSLIGSTDAGAVGTGFGEYARTFPLWLEAGFSIHELLKIITVDSAQALGVGDKTGQLKTGFDADLVVVDGDPVSDIDVMKRVSLSVSQGRPMRVHT